MTTPKTPRISLDYTKISIVVRCSGCPWWAGFALDKIEGWSVGTRHQETFHPETQQAQQNLIRARKHARARK